MKIIDTHQHLWTPAEFGDVHYGIERKRLKKQLAAAHVRLLHEEEAGISRSGGSVGRDANFSNFLLLGQVNTRRTRRSEQQGYEKETQDEI